MYANTNQNAVEHAKRAGQAVLNFRKYEAETFDKNQAGVESETNQKFVDQGKVLWNTGVNTVEGTINTGIDLIRLNNGRNPLALVDPFRPRVDFSGIKADYRSEMMRTDVNGKLDGNGLKRGDFTEGAVTILAPLVVGSKINSVARMTGEIVKPKIGNINIPVKVEVGTATTAEGLQIPVITTETKPLREVFGKPKDLNVFESRANGFPNQRIPSSSGNWNGKVGESGWLSNKPEVIAVTGGKPVPFKKGFPVFDKWKVGEVKLPNMKGNHTTDFDDADELFAKSKKWFDKEGQPDLKRAGKFRTDNDLTWHHHEDKTTMQLVPKNLNNEIPHTGGVSFVKRANKK
jgi:DNase/tRNase domain of colicin-like bacteriocin